MLNVSMLSVVMLNVVAPQNNLRTSYDHYLGRGAHLYYSENALAYYTKLVTTYTLYF
jgi:hypothetical protein